MKLTKQAQRAIDFAMFCTGWHYVPNDDFEEGYAWQNAEIGNVPFDGVPLRKYSSDALYEEFVQQNKEPQLKIMPLKDFLAAQIREAEDMREYQVTTDTLRGWIDLYEMEPQPTEQTDLPAPNTVMWWLCRIADPEIRRKAIKNLVKGRELLKELNVNECIKCGFDWRHSSEGHDYWSTLAYSEIPLLPEPDFTEYNELRK